MGIRKNRLSFTMLKVFILVFFFLLVVLPIFWMTVTSLKPADEIVDVNGAILPKQITLQNYVALFDLLNYAGFVKNSVLLSVVSSIVVVICSILGGYVLARYKFRGKSVLVLTFLATQIVPMILVIIPLFGLFTDLGLINTYASLGFYYILLNLPFCVITMRSFFERIPVALEEAARVDGCNKFMALIHVIIPILLPGIVAVFAFAFIGAWNEFVGSVVFTNNPEMWTIPVGLKSLIGKYNVRWGELMAGGVLALIPTACMFMFVQKYIVAGLTSGAVKE